MRSSLLVGPFPPAMISRVLPPKFGVHLVLADQGAQFPDLPSQFQIELPLPLKPVGYPSKLLKLFKHVVTRSLGVMGRLLKTQFTIPVEFCLFSIIVNQC